MGALKMEERMAKNWWGDEPQAKGPQVTNFEGPHPYDNWIKDWEKAGKDGNIDLYASMERALDRWLADLIIEPLTEPMDEKERADALKERGKQRYRLAKSGAQKGRYVDRSYDQSAYYKPTPYGTLRQRKILVEPHLAHMFNGYVGEVEITERWNTKEWVVVSAKKASHAAKGA
jgi:hypothetical protein